VVDVATCGLDAWLSVCEFQLPQASAILGAGQAGTAAQPTAV
jgi:hypothetical protein